MKTKKYNKLNFFVLAFIFAFALLCPITSVTPVYASSINSLLASSVAGFQMDEAGYNLIKTPADLVLFSSRVNSGAAGNANFKITNDIDMTGVHYTTAGSSSYPYRGNFIGGNQNVVITGLTVSLFGYTTGNAIISNIELKGGSNNASKQYLGGIVDYAINTTVTRCRNDRIVTNNFSTYSDNLTIYTGGVVGYASGGKITECFASGGVSNTSSKVFASYVGGIVGKAVGATVNNCYVINSEIKANATVKTKNEITMKVNHSVHYSILTGFSEEAQAKLADAKKQLEKAQKEFNSANSESNGIKKQIDNMKRNISNAQADLRKATSNLGKCKWYEFGKIAKYTAQIVYHSGRIAAYGASLGALYTAQASVNAALWVAQQAMNVASSLVKALEVSASQVLRDSQWVNNYKDSIRKIEIVDAYAYGIGSSTKAVADSYTANVKTTGGYEYTTYNYHLKFWANIAIAVNFYGSSGPIDTTIIYKNTDKNGKISDNAKNCFYLESSVTYDRKILLNNVNYFNKKIEKTNSISFEGSSSTWGRIGKQKLTVSKATNSNDVKLYANNSSGTAKKLIHTASFSGTLLTHYGINCNNNLSTLQVKVNGAFSSSIWETHIDIENNYPHLRYKYWQDNV